jgi:hypothetical protein
MSPRYIQHRGRRILYVDLACATPGEHNAALRETEAVVGAAPDRSVLLLVDLSFAGVNAETEALAAQFHASAAGRLRARAVVGASGLKRSLIGAPARAVEQATFDDVGDARDWLAAR